MNPEMRKLFWLYVIALSSVQQVGCSTPDAVQEDSHVPPEELVREPAPELAANTRSRIKRSRTPEFAPLKVDTIWRKSCAQYAICVVLNGMGYPTDYDQVSRKMNPKGEATCAKRIAEHLDPIIGARRHNRGSVRDLWTQIDADKCAILAVDYDVGNPHFIVVTDYHVRNGKIVEWEILDSLWGHKNETGVASLSHEELLARWAKPCGPNNDKYSNYWIEVGTKLPGAK
jgi:hypothetical protein